MHCLNYINLCLYKEESQANVQNTHLQSKHYYALSTDKKCEIKAIRTHSCCKILKGCITRANTYFSHISE